MYDSYPISEAMLQTDPCGVEAGDGERLYFRGDSLQTDPCGVEARETDACHRMKEEVTDGPLWGRSLDRNPS
ncbi:hypothetical protein NJ7G_0932 [Natrinema sp. J7-2]|nr:hypothetical protein NJ7G_0932 [Natrinema sp. J7-2]